MYLNEFFKDADMILVGIGENFQDKFDEIEVADEKNVTILEDYVQSRGGSFPPRSALCIAWKNHLLKIRMLQ